MSYAFGAERSRRGSGAEREYTSIFAALGTKVTAVETQETMVDFGDQGIAEALRFYVRDLSVTFRIGEEVTAVVVGPEAP